jgi:nucleotide-binding universal stress UspA family protein
MGRGQALIERKTGKSGLRAEKGGKDMASQILVPLDGSSLAEQALSCAAMLARGLPSELVLFRAVSIPAEDRAVLGQAGVETESLLARLETEARNYLAELVEPLAHQQLTARCVVERGPAAEAILDYAGQANVDHIVMATHGYSGINRWTHGSVAERVLQTARVPLLLIRAAKPDPARDWQQPLPCRRILVPLDGSAVAEQILPPVATVARAVDAELILFQVPIIYVSGWMTGEWYLPIQGVLDTAEASAQAYLGAVAGRLKEQGLDAATATSSGSVANCIVTYAEANHVDLIAMCTHGRTGLARWALGSVTDRVLRAGSTPILLVRAQ